MMQTFKDTETGKFWQFDDDVIADASDGFWRFKTSNADPLDVPRTLIPAELPPIEDLIEPFVPRIVSRWQGREAMRLTPYGPESDGVSLFDAVETLLARPDTPAYYRTAWDEIQQFELDSPVLLAIAGELGLQLEGLPTLFEFAATLRA